jgi:hypothetical protein
LLAYRSVLWNASGISSSITVSRAVDKPPPTNAVPARSDGVNQEGSQPLDPTVDCDVIHLDATLRKEFFNVSEGQPIPDIPTHSQRDHLGREPVANER